MSTTEEQLIGGITTALATVQERYPGYRSQLKATLSSVVFLERQHVEQHMDIKIQIKNQCATAGDQLFRKSQETGEDLLSAAQGNPA